jgi:hypothetical protein
VQPGGRERHTVVGADRRRQTVLANARSKIGRAVRLSVERRP